MSTCRPVGWGGSEYKSLKSPMTVVPTMTPMTTMTQKTNNCLQNHTSSENLDLRKLCIKKNYFQSENIFVTYSITPKMSDSPMSSVSLVTQELETQSLNAIIAGFSFAAAMSWVDVTRWMTQQLVKMPRNGGATTPWPRSRPPVVYHCLLDHFSCLVPRLQASATSFRDYSLIGGRRRMRNNRTIPMNTITPMEIYSFHL